MNVALVVPSVFGGVATVSRNLQRGLASEGFQVDLIKLNDGSFPLLSNMRNDTLNIKYLPGHDVVLYVGNIPWPSHLLAKLIGIPVALFIHGYIYSELFYTMLHGNRLKERFGAIAPLIMLKTASSLKTIDLYICHSLCVREVNKIPSSNFVLLPQWVYPDELESAKISISSKSNNDVVRIVTYASHAFSPRLLNDNHLVTLAMAIKRLAKLKFELIVIDPHGFNHFPGPIKIVRSMSRKKFLSFLASADLFIERSIDEELRLTALEAMAMGIPVAKLTHLKYWENQDYCEKDLLLARSFKELIEKVVEYVNNLEYYYSYYSKHVREFVQKKRTWNAVKEPFLTALKNISLR